MKIEKVNPDIKYLYHYTKKENVAKILKDKKIISSDKYTFFTQNLIDAKKSFEEEIMQEDKLYIDINGILRKRGKNNRNEYCILKIPYINDNNFYKFTFDNQDNNSIYGLSLTHYGEYCFENAKVLEIPDNKHIFKIFKGATTFIVAGMLLFPFSVSASSWLDKNNYDVSWYANTTLKEYMITNEKELAGLAYLVNNENKTFDGIIFNIASDIDLTDNTWETIEEIFKGAICGSHRILLNYTDGELIKNQKIELVKYSFNTLIANNNLITKVEVSYPYTVKKLKEKIGNVTYVYYNNEELQDSKSLFELNLATDDVIEIYKNNYIFIEDVFGNKRILSFESGDSIDNIKKFYGNKVNISPDKIILKYNDQILEDGRTIADYNIQKYSVLNAYIKSNISINGNKINNIGDIYNNNNYLNKDIINDGDKIYINLKNNNNNNNLIIDKILINGKNIENNSIINDTLIIDNKYLSSDNKINDLENIDIQIIYKNNDIENEKQEIISEDNDNINEEDKIVNEEIENPKTRDNILSSILSGIMSLMSIVGISINLKRRNKKIN